MRNEFRGEQRYVIRDEQTKHYVSWYDLDLVHGICYLKGPNDDFIDKSRNGLNELDRNAILAADVIRVPCKMTYEGRKALSWKSVVDVERVAAVLEREADAHERDHWKVYNIPRPTHVLSNG